MSGRSLVAVTSSAVPYLYDLPHILSLPKGFEARFRYFVDWVAPGVIHNGEGGVSAHAGRRLVLVFHSLDTGRLIPLREATVIALERLGPLYYLKFAVGDFMPLSSRLVGPHKTIRQEVFESESKRVEAIGREIVGVSPDRDLKQPLPRGSFLRLIDRGWSPCGPPEGWSPESIDIAWATAVAMLWGEPSLVGVPMFHLLGFKKRDGGDLTPSTMPENQFESGARSGCGYELRRGERYRLRLLQWRSMRPGSSSTGTPPERVGEEGDKVPSKQKAVRVSCKVDDALLTVEGKSDMVVGRYDVLEYLVRTTATGYSELSLSVSQELKEADGPSSWPRLYETRVPVRVRVGLLRRLRTWGVGVLGALLFVLPTTHLVSWLNSRPTVVGVLQLIGVALLVQAFQGDLPEVLKSAHYGKALLPFSPHGSS